MNHWYNASYQSEKCPFKQDPPEVASVMLLPVRFLKKWKAYLLLISFVLVIWILLSSTKSPAVESHQRTSSSVSYEKYEDILIVDPLKRSPVPSVSLLAKEGTEEENAAKEVEEPKKDLPKQRDENAAHEEHSGQVNNFGNFVNERKNVTKHNLKKPLLAPKPNQDLNLKNDKELEDPESFHLLGEFKEEINDYDKIKDIKNEIIPKPRPVQPQVKEIPDEESFHQLPEHQRELPDDKYGDYNNWRNLTLQEIDKLSYLGKRLFLNEKTGISSNRRFKIHFWKYYEHIERRLIKRYTDEYVDPFEDCSVNNCDITHRDSDIDDADAVIFHLHRINGPQIDIKRNESQLWIWLSDESPYNVFMVAKDKNLDHYKGLFNLSMTYRMDSDIPVPYGRTVPLPKDQYLDQVVDIFSKKKKNIAILSSNCGGGSRFAYLKELQKHIDVDVYGRCGPLKCPGHFNKDCPLINDYKFYLAFENGLCDDYITEKVWWNGFHKGAVPVVMGPPRANYERLLPPNSFIHVDDFANPKQLAIYLSSLLTDKKQYNSFHQWRTRYAALNEHGYFSSPVYHFCRVCEALNYNALESRGRVSDISGFFSSKNHCYAPKWKPL